MAKGTLSNESLTMTLYIDGDPSRKSLMNLGKEAEKMAKEVNKASHRLNELVDSRIGINDLQDEMKRLNKTIADKKALGVDTTKFEDDLRRVKNQYISLVRDVQREDLELGTGKLAKNFDEAEIAVGKFNYEMHEQGKKVESLNKDLQEYHDSMDTVRKTIDIASMSTSELRQESHRLKMEMDKENPKTEEYSKYSTELEKVKNRQQELRVNTDLLKKEYDITAQSIEQLEARTRALNHSIKKLNPQNDAAKLREYKEEVNQLRNRTNELKFSMNGLDSQIDANSSSIEELENHLRGLKIALRRAEPNSEKMAAYRMQIERVESRVKQLTTGHSRMRMTFDKWAQRANDYQTILASLAAGFYLVQQATSTFISGMMSTSDVISEAQKTTGLLDSEILNVRRNFRDFDTRTAGNDLTNILRIAGKMGIEGTGSLTQFTKAGNVLNVALGKALGGNVEETTNKVGKLAGVFKLFDTMGIENGIMAVTNVLNELGKKSKANESDILEFTRRLSGSAEAAGFSYDQIMALGASLSDLGAPVEMASTAVGRFMFSLSSDMEKYADMINIPLDEYVERLGTDVMGVFTDVLKSAKHSGVGLAALSETFEDLGAEGVRMKQTMGLLVNNTDNLSTQLSIAKQETIDQTSAMKEYNMMNDNFAGKMLRAKKRIAAVVFELAIKLKPAIEKATEGVVWFVTNLKTIFKVITIITIAFFSYSKAVKIANLSMMDFRRTLVKVRQAWRALNLTMKANPWALLAAALVTMVATFILFYDQINKSAVSTADFNRELLKEKTNLNNLFGVLEKSKKGTESRKNAIEKINELYGKYLPNLLTEKSTLDEIKIAQDQVNNAMREAIAIKSKQKDIENAQTESIDAQKDYSNEIINSIRKKKGYSVAGIAASELQEIIKKREVLGIMSDESDKLLKDFSKKYDAWGMPFFRRIKKIHDARLKEKHQLIEIDAFYNAYISTLERSNEVKEEGLPVTPSEVEEESDSSKGGKSPLEKMLANLDKSHKKKMVLIKSNYVDEKTTKEEFDSEMLKEELDYNKQKLAILPKAGKDALDVENTIADLRIRAMKKGDAKMTDEIAKFEDELYLMKQEGVDKEIVQAMQKYDALREQADKYGIDTIDFEKMLADEIAKIKKTHADKELKKQKDKLADQARQFQGYANEIVGLFGQNFKERKNLEKQYQEEKERLNEQHRNKEISAQDYKKQISALDKQHAEDQVATRKQLTKDLVAAAISELQQFATIIIGKIAIGSLGTGQSITTAGIAGIAQAAAMTLLVNGALEGVKQKVMQNYSGRYPVVGADDGKQYNVPYRGQLQTGYLPSGAALFNERGNEAVIEYKHLQNPVVRVHYEKILDAVNRKPQYADGRYPAADGATPPTFDTDVFSALSATVNGLTEELSNLRKNGIIAKNDMYAIREDLSELDKRQGKAKG
jgi:TP901 family phage tail tape measure protein